MHHRDAGVPRRQPSSTGSGAERCRFGRGRADAEPEEPRSPTCGIARRGSPAAAALGATDSKFETFSGALRGVLDENDHSKVIVFTFFRRTIAYLERELARRGVSPVVIHGDVKPDERAGGSPHFQERPTARAAHHGGRRGGPRLPVLRHDRSTTTCPGTRCASSSASAASIATARRATASASTRSSCAAPSRSASSSGSTCGSGSSRSRSATWSRSSARSRRSLTKSVFASELSPEEEAEMAERFARMVIERREEERALAERARTPGPGRALIMDNVHDTVQSGRYVSPDELRAVVAGYLTRRTAVSWSIMRGTAACLPPARRAADARLIAGCGPADIGRRPSRSLRRLDRQGMVSRDLHRAISPSSGPSWSSSISVTRWSGWPSTTSERHARWGPTRRLPDRGPERAPGGHASRRPTADTYLFVIFLLEVTGADTPASAACRSRSTSGGGGPMPWRHASCTSSSRRPVTRRRRDHDAWTSVTRLDSTWRPGRVRDRGPGRGGGRAAERGVDRGQARHAGADLRPPDHEATGPAGDGAGRADPGASAPGRSRTSSEISSRALAGTGGESPRRSPADADRRRRTGVEIPPSWIEGPSPEVETCRVPTLRRDSILGVSRAPTWCSGHDASRSATGWSIFPEGRSRMSRRSRAVPARRRASASKAA